jgi:cation transport regulator ChaC
MKTFKVTVRGVAYRIPAEDRAQAIAIAWEKRMQVQQNPVELVRVLVPGRKTPKAFVGTPEEVGVKIVRYLRVIRRKKLPA